MGGVNLLLQNRCADENCYRGTLSICLKLRISIANMQAISKSNTIDKTASIFISSLMISIVAYGMFLQFF